MARPTTELPVSNAPEGGWGWYIALAFALNNVVVIPLVQLFTLLYKDLLKSLLMSDVEIHTIVATNCSFGMLLAIFNGPVLRKFGYRKIAIFGILLIFCGNLLTSQSSTFWEFMICFSILVSVGMNLTMAAFHLALNTYFVVKRGVATGIAMSITGFGPILMPLVTNFLMDEYGARQAGIIFSGIALHSLIGACVLQPVKWHRKRTKRLKDESKKTDDIELGANKIESNQCCKVEANLKDQRADVEDEPTPSTKLMAVVEAEAENLDVDSVLKLSSIVSDVPPSAIISASTVVEELKSTSGGESGSDSHPDCTEKISDKDQPKIENEDQPDSPKENNDQKLEAQEEVTASTKLMHDVDLEEAGNKSKKKSKSKDENNVPLKSLDDVVPRHTDTVMERLVKFFDFDLLSDPVYVNISLGLSIAFVSEMNFTLMLPFILEERAFDNGRIAKMLSILAGADIVSRFVSPFFGQSIKSKVRIVYLVSLVSGIFCRICFLYAETYFSTIIVILALGITKGIRTVYTALVIPTYVPLPKLASATGLQMVNNGLLFLIFGPFMGSIRQGSKNYNLWIQVTNCFTACTILMWFTEIYLIRSRKKQKKVPIVIRMNNK